MSDIEKMESPSAHLEHYGVPGMRWGVRKREAHNQNLRVAAGQGSKKDKANVLRKSTAFELARDKGNAQKIAERRASKSTVRQDKGKEGRVVSTRKAKRLDKKFDRDAKSLATTFKVYNRAAVLTNERDVARINNKPEYKGMDFRKPSPLREKYYKEHQNAFINNLDKAAAEIGTNATGTKKLAVVVKDDLSWDIEVERVRHADTDDREVEMHVSVKYDSRGHISSVEIDDDEAAAAHSDSLVEDFLAHYGVPGMRWGQRKDRSGGSNPSEVKVKSTPGKRVKAAGGKQLPASEDAVNAAIAKAKAKSSTTDALSNKELQTLVTRMNLERQLSDLQKGDPSANRGKKFVDRLMGKKPDKGVRMNPLDEIIAEQLRKKTAAE